MQEMAVSKLKATCLAVVEDVRRTGVAIRITKFGKPIADLVPISAPPGNSWIGSMRDSGDIVGDIVGPIGAFGDWDDPRS